MLTPEPRNQSRSIPHLKAPQQEIRQRDASESKSRIIGDIVNTNQPEQQQAKEVDLVLVKDKPVLKKTTKLGSTSYKYNGPVNRDIQDFLEDLYRREGPVHHRGPFEKLITINERIDKRLEKIFPKGCTDGPLSLNKDAIFLFLVMIAGATYFSTRIDAETENASSDAMKVLNKFGALYVFIFTFYGIVFLSLPVMWALIVLLLQSLIPTILILFDYNLIFRRNNVPEVDITNTAIRVCAAILPVFWSLIYPVYKLAKFYIGRFTSHVIIAALYVGVVLFAVGIPALAVIAGKEALDIEFLFNHSDSIVVVSAIFVSLSWIIIHIKYFWVPTQILETTLMQMAQKQAKKEGRTKSPDVVRDGLIAIPTKKERLMRNIYWISSLVIGGIYIGMEMYLLNRIIVSLEEGSIDGLVMSVLFFLATPLFLILGLPIAMAKIRAKNKTLFLPIIVMIPMFCLIPVTQAFETVTSTNGFTLFVIIGPPVVIFFWLAMAFLNLKKRRLLYLISTFMCVFFFLPFVFLGLSEADLFDSVKSGFKITFYTFIGIFGAVVVLILFWRSLKSLRSYIETRIKEKRRQQKMQKEIKERLKVLRKQRLERMKARAQGGMDIDEDIDEDEDDDLEMEELERREKEGGMKSTVNPSRTNLESKKGSRNDLESARDNKRKLSKGNENELNDNEEDKAKKKLNMLKEVERNRRMKLVKLMYLNFKNFGYWINAAAFIVSYTFVAYAYFNFSSTATDTEGGILLGVTIVVPVIFVLNNLIIRLKTAKLSEEERKIHSLKKEPERKFFEKQLERDQERLDKATIIEVYILLLGVLLIPLMQVPLFIIFTDRSVFITNLFIMIISILFSIFLAGMVEIKKRTGPFNKFFVPSFISICWIMVVLPFVVAIPLVSAVLENDTDEYEIFVQTSLTGSAFILMTGVTFFAIVINVLFQKLEKEKLIKFIVKTLQRVVKEHSVKADDVVLRKLVEEYLKKDTEEEINALKEGIVFDKNPLAPLYPPKFKVTPDFGAAILLTETFKKIALAQQLKKEKEAKNPKKVKKEKEKKVKTTLFEKLASCCTDKEIEEIIEENFDEDHIQEIVPEKEDSYFKADHYLPLELGDNMWNVAAGNYTPDMLNSGDNLTNMTEGNDVLEEYHPVLGLKPTEVDFKLRDAMTPILDKIAVKPVSGGEVIKLNNSEHGIIIYESMNQMEVWYQHVYDYFSGKSDPDARDTLSQGMIYQNFQHFLRVTEINENNTFSKKDLENNFALHATKKAEKGCCLGYTGFVQLLTEIANKTVAEGPNDIKVLRRFTKKIYPAIMARIPSIAKSYSGAVISFSKSKTPYDPQLDLFNKNRLLLSVNQENPDTSSETLGKKQLRSNVHILRQIQEEPYTRHLSNIVQRNIGNKSPKSGAMLSSESLLLHGDKSPTLRDKTKKKSRCNIKKICRNMFLAMNVCWLSFTSKLGKCMDTVFVRNPKLFGDWVYKKTKKVGKVLGFSIDEESDNEEDAIIKRVSTDAPSWPIIMDKIFSVIPKAQILYFQKQGKKGISLQFNMTNLIAIIGKIAEIYGFMAFAFRTEIPWFEDDTASAVILATNVEVSWWKTFQFLFWIAVGLVAIYFMISLPAIYYLRKGKLGEDREGKSASFPHPQFFLTTAVTILGGSLFTQIMRFIMEAYVCDFSEEPWVLMKDSSIECLSDEHAMYMGVGVIALLIYYPISTFMFPNFQFQSKALDLKYDPTYIVIQIQARLIITGFISFFKVNDPNDTTSVITQLIGVSVTLFLLSLASIILKPCLIMKANIWDAGAYFAASWVNICAIVVVIERDSVIGAIMLGVGGFAIIAATIFVIHKFYGTKSKKRRNNDLVVTYDPVKRQALVPVQLTPPAAIAPEIEIPKKNYVEEPKQAESILIPETKKFMF